MSFTGLAAPAWLWRVFDHHAQLLQDGSGPGTSFGLVQALLITVAHKRAERRRERRAARSKGDSLHQPASSLGSISSIGLRNTTETQSVNLISSVYISPNRSPIAARSQG